MAVDLKVTITDRILGCVKGIATGDAIGKQTELLSYEDVFRWYPHGIGGFEGTPGSIIPRYAGNRKREWRIGETTDDTERTIAVARAIIGERGRVDHTSVGREMLRCTKCVHPGVESLWEFHQAADPARMARTTTGVELPFASRRSGSSIDRIVWTISSLARAKPPSQRTAGPSPSLPPPRRPLLYPRQSTALQRLTSSLSRRGGRSRAPLARKRSSRHDRLAMGLRPLIAMTFWSVICLSSLRGLDV